MIDGSTIKELSNQVAKTEQFGTPKSFSNFGYLKLFTKEMFIETKFVSIADHIF